MTDERLSNAIVLYLGYGRELIPRELGRSGESTSVTMDEDIREKVDNVLATLNAVRPDWRIHTLASGAKWAVEQTVEQFPELGEQAKEALEWAYSWWWR